MKIAAIQLTVCLVLSGCGGGGGSNAVGIITPPVGTPTCGATVPTSGAFKITFPSVNEVEPNDDISTANPVNLPTPAAPEDRVGIIVLGSINDTSDLADTFSFTSSRTKQFFFKFCEASCNTGSGNDKDGAGPGNFDRRHIEDENIRNANYRAGYREA